MKLCMGKISQAAYPWWMLRPPVPKGRIRHAREYVSLGRTTRGHGSVDRASTPGSRELIARAVEAEFVAFLATYDAALDDEGRRQVVRNGYLPEREVQTGIGSVFVRVPRARDRSGSGIVFHSNLLPPYLRRTKSVEDLIPWLYLKGISTGDFSKALSALLGVNAAGMSASTVSRLKGI